MSLKGWTLPQSATGKSATLPPPPWHYSGEIIAVDFLADPERVAELAPPGFAPQGDGACTFFFADWCSAAEHDPRVQEDPARGQYKEAYVVFVGTFGATPMGRVPYIWVDNELSLIRGLVQGFPKKMGQVFMTRPVDIGRGSSRKAADGRFAAHVSSMGRRLATASVHIEREAKGALPSGLRPLLHTRLWPSLAGDRPAVHEFSTVAIADAAMGTLWQGAAELEFGESEFEELHLLAPRSVGKGWVYSTAFSVTGGQSLPIGGDA